MEREEKSTIKILLITDNHDRIFNSRKIVDLHLNDKFDFVFCCGDVVTVPVEKWYEKQSMELYIPLLKNIFLEMEKIAPIYWVPGNHEPYIFFEDYFEELTSKSLNIHKKAIKLGENLYVIGLGGSVPILSGGEWKKNFIPFENLDFKNYKYKGFPYNKGSNNYLEDDELLRKDLEETISKAKIEGGENIQMIFLTHLGPLLTNTNIIEENGEVLYLGSKALGEIFEREKNAFIDIHGHTHISEGFLSLNKDKYIFNPGANYDGHYATLEISKNLNGKWKVTSFTMDYLE